MQRVVGAMSQKKRASDKTHCKFRAKIARSITSPVLKNIKL